MLKKNFTRKDIYKRINKKIGFSKNLSNKIVDEFFNILINELSNLKKIKLASFGTFDVLNKSKRLGRNPKTKKEAIIRERKIVRFKASKILKNKVNTQ
jgi:integration host factor subunit alpha